MLYPKLVELIDEKDWDEVDHELHAFEVEDLEDVLRSVLDEDELLLDILLEEELDWELELLLLLDFELLLDFDDEEEDDEELKLLVESSLLLAELTEELLVQLLNSLDDCELEE